MNPCKDLIEKMCQLGGKDAPVSYRFLAMFGKEFEPKQNAFITQVWLAVSDQLGSPS